MERRFIDLTVVSARDIKRGSIFGPDKKFVAAWVDPKNKHCTKPADGDGSMPEWNYKLMLPLSGSFHSLTLEIRSKGSFGDTLLGTVHIPVAEIGLDGTREANNKLTYLVERPSGRSGGSLSLYIKIVKQIIDADSVVPILEIPLVTKAASAPPLYPPVENSCTRQNQAEQPYPPAEIIYPALYPPSKPALDSMNCPYPVNEGIPERLPTSDYSGAVPSNDSYPLTTYPPSEVYGYPATSYEPGAPYGYSSPVYPPAPRYSVTAYPSTTPLYPPVHFPVSQQYSCAPRYPPLCGTYPYPDSYSH